MNQSSGIPVLLIVAVILGWLCYNGTFFQTGAQYYETCWQKMHQKDDQPKTSQQAADWAVCDPTADAAIYSAGFIYAGNPDNAVTPQLKTVVAACPSNLSDRPVGGTWILAVKLIQNSGGPKFFDHMQSADKTIAQAFRAKWPNCVSVARANGFPKLIKSGDSWDFETPCLPCKAEEAEVDRKYGPRRS